MVKRKKEENKSIRGSDGVLIAVLLTVGPGEKRALCLSDKSIRLKKKINYAAQLRSLLTVLTVFGGNDWSHPG